MKNALTIDVEDYFHVSNLGSHISRSSWCYLPVRIEENTRRVLDLLSLYGVRATFFVLGWVAERMGTLIREISSAGHEIASHGYDHRLAYELSPDEFRADIRRSKSIIEDVTGARVDGYRATSYSLVKSNLSYLWILAEEGFRYDSSIFPVYHDRYGIPDWERFPALVKDNGCAIYEVPPSTYKLLGNNIPMAGGGYLRLFPVQFLSFCINRINKIEKKPAVIYFHPWELDPGQPRIKIPLQKSFRHYVNLHRTEKKVAHLLNRFKFCPVNEIVSLDEVYCR
ncbi:MAG: polysaccharide [Geobacteraceae bacterium]|nr:MAG: polysaccharide [Geobacteraceae bacterium]